MAPTQWQPDRSAPPEPTIKLATAIGRGLRGRCPVCGQGRIFNGYLRVVAACQSCAAPLGRARADDAPPYFTIFATGHIVIPLIMHVDRAAELSALTMGLIFVPLTLVLSLALLRPIKGATVALMVRLGMLSPDQSQA